MGLSIFQKNSFIRKLAHHSSWYFVCNALNNGLAIILLPFLSNYLTTEEYGVVQLSTGIGLFLPMLFCGGIDKAIYRFFNESNEEQKIKLISTIYWFVLFSGLIVLTLFTLSAPYWFDSILHIKTYPYCYLFAYPYLFLQLATIGLSVCQQSFSLKTMTIVEVTGTAINLLLSIYFVRYIFEDGAFARLLAIAISYIFKFFAYTILLIKERYLSFSFSNNLIKSTLNYALPLLPNSIALWLIRTFDRILVAYFCGATLCGEYSVAVQVSFVVYFLQDSILQALGPLQIKSFIENKAQAVRRVIILSRNMLLLMLGITYIYCSVIPELMIIFLNKNFIPDYTTVILLTSVYIFQAQYRLFSDILAYYKATKWFMYAGIIQAIVGLVLNVLLLPKFGYVSAGISNVFSIIIYTLIIVYACGKYETIRIKWSFYIVHIFIFIILFGCQVIFSDNLFFKYSLLSIVIIIYSFIIQNEIKGRHPVVHTLKQRS